VTVYEQAAEPREVGAGIQISPNASRLLRRYGLGDELEACGVRPEAIEVRRWQDGALLSRQELGARVEREFGAPYYHLHRVDLMRVLTAALPRERVRLGARCVSVEPGGARARARFADGAAIEAGVLVGADGIHSAVRESLFGPDRPRFSRHVAYRGLAPADRLAHLGLERNLTVWVGPGQHFVHYFVSAGHYVNFVAVVEDDGWSSESWVELGRVADAQAAFAGWHPQPGAILSAVDETFKWALFDRPPLERWAVGRAALLGDACHPMLPQMAQGAAQAIEDGATLAACLREGAADPAAALERYVRLRRPRATRVQAMAAENARGFHLPDGPEQARRDAAFAAGSGNISSGMVALFGHDAEALGDEPGPA
jgi:salicylate hydroxylase